MHTRRRWVREYLSPYPPILLTSYPTLRIENPERTTVNQSTGTNDISLDSATGEFRFWLRAWPRSARMLELWVPLQGHDGRRNHTMQNTR